MKRQWMTHQSHLTFLVPALFDRETIALYVPLIFPDPSQIFVAVRAPHTTAT
jgi:hypothetical protein